MILFNLNKKKQQHNILTFHEVLLVVLNDAAKTFWVQGKRGMEFRTCARGDPFPIKHKSYINEAQQNLYQTSQWLQQHYYLQLY